MSAEYPWALNYDFRELDDDGMWVDMQCYSEKGTLQCLHFRDHAGLHRHRELSWTDEEEED
jgi:hypothetical protein